MKQIQQAVTKESVFNALYNWCRHGAGKRGLELNIISAFVSGAGVEAMEPLFDIFLSHGNSVTIIAGVDRKGTSREAIQRLYDLQSSYPKRFATYVFSAPSRVAAIFHPKLYLYRAGNRVSVIIGSANLTVGGLGNNFESVWLYSDMPMKSEDAVELLRAWETFRTPQKKLKRFLKLLDLRYKNKLVKALPSEKNGSEGKAGKKGAKGLWTPLSRLPYSPKPPRRPPLLKRSGIAEALLIDILTETRGTQMQIPLDVLEGFFKVDRHSQGNIDLSYIRGGKLSQPIQRHIVHSGHMRRIEMPDIKDLTRPLAALFIRRTNGEFAVALVPRESSQYHAIDDFLEKNGQATRLGRRHYIGAVPARIITRLRPLIGSIK